MVDVSAFSRDNDGVKFLLTVIDIFSKRAWVLPLQNKSGKQVSQSLKLVLDECNPFYLQTDKGKEFLNKDVTDVLRQYNVRHFTSENENIKASIAERFNRSFRNTLHRFFTKTGSHRYLDSLIDLVKAYNSRYHNSIGMSPNEVGGANEEDIWYKLYNPDNDFDQKLSKLKADDFVRVTKARTAFQRGYTPNWSMEVFRVVRILPTKAVTYSIKDFNGEPIIGTFYERELQKIKEPQQYDIEEIIRRRTVGGKKQVFVKWVGYPDSFNQWIPEKDIIDN